MEPVKRYKYQYAPSDAVFPYDYDEIVEDPDGDYVKYTDYARAIATLQQVRNMHNQL